MSFTKLRKQVITVSRILNIRNFSKKNLQKDQALGFIEIQFHPNREKESLYNFPWMDGLPFVTVRFQMIIGIDVKRSKIKANPFSKTWKCWKLTQQLPKTTSYKYLMVEWSMSLIYFWPLPSWEKPQLEKPLKNLLLNQHQPQ